MKKLLLLALIPSLSFACIDEENVALNAKMGRVGDKIHLYADYYFSVTNHTDKDQEYYYTFELCPAKKKCEVHKSHILVAKHSEQKKVYRLNKFVKYRHPGTYVLIAKINVVKHPNEHMHSEFKDQLKVIK